MKVSVKCVVVAIGLLFLTYPFSVLGFDLSGNVSLFIDDSTDQPIVGARIAASTDDGTAVGCPADIPSVETLSTTDGVFTLSNLPDNTLVQLRVEGTPYTDGAYGEFITVHLPFIDWSTLPQWMLEDLRQLSPLNKDYVESELAKINALDLPDVDRSKGIVVGSIVSDECPDIPVGAVVKISSYIVGATILYQDADGTWNPSRMAMAGSGMPFIIYNLDLSGCNSGDIMVWAEKEGSNYSSYNKVRVYAYQSHEGATCHISAADMLVLDACDSGSNDDDGGGDDGGGGSGCFISSMIH